MYLVFECSVENLLFSLKLLDLFDFLSELNRTHEMGACLLFPLCVFDFVDPGMLLPQPLSHKKLRIDLVGLKVDVVHLLVFIHRPLIYPSSCNCTYALFLNDHPLGVEVDLVVTFLY
jgi:hypothetical protein